MRIFFWLRVRIIKQETKQNKTSQNNSANMAAESSAYSRDYSVWVPPKCFFVFQLKLLEPVGWLSVNQIVLLSRLTAANSGAITLRQNLDHETKSFYNITIAASDLGSPTLTGYAHLLVTVTDVDDNAPVFHKDKYTASLLENATAGTFVSQVNATDMDAAHEHNTIYYRIDGGNADRKFVIGELNGTVFLNWTGVGLDREKVSSYSLTVAAISRVNGTEQKSTVVVSI